MKFPLLLLATAAALCFDQEGTQEDQHGDPLPKHAIVRLGTARLRHGDRACGVYFLSDGKTVASAGGDGRVRLWDVATGKLLREHIGHDLCFRALTLSPDGKTLAAAGGSADCRVYFWDALTGKELGVVKGEMDVSSLAFSPDSKRLAWVTLESQLVLWNRSSSIKKTIHVATDRAFHNVTFSPDGKTLAVGDDRGTVRLIDAETEKLKLKWKHDGESPSVECIRFSHDGTKIATAGGLYTPIQIWEAKSGKLLHTLKLEWQLDYAIAFSPDDKTLVSQHDRNIILWDVETGKKRKVIALSTRDYATAFSFSLNGKILAVGHDGHAISLLDLTTDKPLFPLEAHRGAVISAKFLPGERTIASASSDGTIRFWAAATGKQERQISCGKAGPRCIAAKSDGKVIAWGGQGRSIHFCDPLTGKDVERLTGHELDVTCLAFSPNGTRLVSAASTILKVWDLSSAKCLATLDHEYGVKALLFLPDGKRFVSAGYDHAICVWNADTGKLTYKMEGHTDSASMLAASADGKLLVSAGGLDPNIRLWDVERRKQIGAIRGRGDGIGSLAVSPDGKRVAFSYWFEPEITVWDIAAQKSVRAFNGHVGHIYSLSFSADGSRLISSGSDTTMIVWNTLVDSK